MINSVDVSDPTLIFTADEWSIFGWNDGQAYVARERHGMNGRGRGCQGGGHDVGRGYGRAVGSHKC